MNFRAHYRQRVLASACITGAIGAGMVMGAHPVSAATAQRAGNATPTYTLRKISNLSGYGLTLNGNAYGYNLRTTVAEVVTPAGKVTTLTTPRGNQSTATSGYGRYYAGQNFTTGTAVRWTLTGTSVKAQTLASVDHNGSLAEGVDAAGAVVGQSDGLAVLWKAGSTAVTRLPLAAGYTGGEATSISANGAIIAGGVVTSAFRWRAATWLRGSSGGYVIHLLTGTGTEVEAVNGAGIEVGGQLFGSGQAYEWLPKSNHTFQAVDLGGPAGAGCIATAMNNASAPSIIGDCNSGKTIYAWIYRGHQTLTDLQPVIAKVDRGVTATRALGTDGAGQLLIEAQGTVFADYVLTPTST
ncbi:MAG TPA: hypothetical protein VF482_01930 [Trebonia sp.]